MKPGHCSALLSVQLHQNLDSYKADDTVLERRVGRECNCCARVVFPALAGLRLNSAAAAFATTAAATGAAVTVAIFATTAFTAATLTAATRAAALTAAAAAGAAGAACSSVDVGD